LLITEDHVALVAGEIFHFTVSHLILPVGVIHGFLGKPRISNWNLPASLDLISPLWQKALLDLPSHCNVCNNSPGCRGGRIFDSFYDISRPSSDLLLYSFPQSFRARPHNHNARLSCLPCRPLSPWSTMSRPPSHARSTFNLWSPLHPQQRQLRLQALAQSALQKGRRL
jgi:hypothetical protein